MKKRSIGVTLLGIFIIAMGLYNLARFMYVTFFKGSLGVTPDYVRFARTEMFTYLFWSCLWLISGIFLLQLKSWVRKFIIIISLIQLFPSILVILVQHDKDLISTLIQVIILLTIVIFLTRVSVRKQFMDNGGV